MELTIKSTKQKNGLWGLPLMCRKIDKFIPLDINTEIIYSAILIGIAEYYFNQEFEISFSSSEGFLVSFNEGKTSPMYINFCDYTVQDNRLIWNKK